MFVLASFDHHRIPDLQMQIDENPGPQNPQPPRGGRLRPTRRETGVLRPAPLRR